MVRAMVRLIRYDADVRAMFARASQLLRVTFTHVYWLTPPVLPASYDCGSVVAVEPVMRRKGLRRLSRLEPPLSAACAMALRHTLIVANP
jgi:hypothetical protein